MARPVVKSQEREDNDLRWIEIICRRVREGDLSDEVKDRNIRRLVETRRDLEDNGYGSRWAGRTKTNGSNGKRSQGLNGSRESR